MNKKKNKFHQIISMDKGKCLTSTQSRAVKFSSPLIRFSPLSANKRAMRFMGEQAVDTMLRSAREKYSFPFVSLWFFFLSFGGCFAGWYFTVQRNVKKLEHKECNKKKYSSQIVIKHKEASILISEVRCRQNQGWVSDRERDKTPTKPFGTISSRPFLYRPLITLPAHGSISRIRNSILGFHWRLWWRHEVTVYF